MTSSMTAPLPVAASATLDSPFGRLLIATDGKAITRLTWQGGDDPTAAPAGPRHPLLERAARQLAEYFAGRRRVFELPLAPRGGALQQAVCQAMLEIPCGETRSYGDLAKALGVAAQPIGQACGGNPIAIIIPCHRILGSDRRLTGFGGGLKRKRWLLEHEGAAFRV